MRWWIKFLKYERKRRWFEANGRKVCISFCVFFNFIFGFRFIHRHTHTHTRTHLHTNTHAHLFILLIYNGNNRIIMVIRLILYKFVIYNINDCWEYMEECTLQYSLCYDFFCRLVGWFECNNNCHWWRWSEKKTLKSTMKSIFFLNLSQQYSWLIRMGVFSLSGLFGNSWLRFFFLISFIYVGKWLVIFKLRTFRFGENWFPLYILYTYKWIQLLTVVYLYYIFESCFLPFKFLFFFVHFNSIFTITQLRWLAS